MHSTAAIGGQPEANTAIGRERQELGIVCQFAARIGGRALAPIGELLYLLQNTQSLGQLKVYLNGYGECVGYVAWALLTPDVEQEFIAGQHRALREWEFNDGTSAWILDMGAAPGSLLYILEDLRDVVFNKHEQLTYFRTKGGQTMCKRVSRCDRTTFMAAGRQERCA